MTSEIDRVKLYLLLACFGVFIATVSSRRRSCRKRKVTVTVQMYYKKCVEKGYKSKFGCSSNSIQKSKVPKRRCRKMESRLRKCKFSCPKGFDPKGFVSEKAVKKNHTKKNLAPKSSSIARNFGSNFGFETRPVDGEWSGFGSWSHCSDTCGGGTKNRTRTCTNPTPAFGGRHCVGHNSQTQDCNTTPCPLNGGWSGFGSWSACSKECGGGAQIRTRNCTHPIPAYGGEHCVGPSSETQPCNSNPCPVDGGWTEFGSWSNCSEPCDGGFQNRTRTCTNPTPAYKGRNCVGTATQIQKCNSRPCSIDGEWAEFGSWSMCSKPCGEGKQVRNRTCTNPTPDHGGMQCLGPRSQAQICNSKPCPVTGEWSIFGIWSSCSKTCGGGNETRSRNCSNPTPAFGGKDCTGDYIQTQDCNTTPCPLNGGWSGFGSWSACSKECGGGDQIRTRNCINPIPAYGGRKCPGTDSEIQACNNNPCPRDGAWSDFGSWSRCSKSCGRGTQIRRRSCSNPSPASGGTYCVGSAANTQTCNVQPCPRNGGWGGFGSWSKCSKVCGRGLHTKRRSCSDPYPGYGGRYCVGSYKHTQLCNTQPCPRNGGWGGFGIWSKCTKTCGGGTQTKTRSCNNPIPAYGGRGCIGGSSLNQACNTTPCKSSSYLDAIRQAGLRGPSERHWGSYGSWSGCTRQCGGGTQSRRRACLNPSSRRCEGSGYQFRICNTQLCIVKKPISWSEHLNSMKGRKPSGYKPPAKSKFSFGEQE